MPKGERQSSTNMGGKDQLKRIAVPSGMKQPDGEVNKREGERQEMTSLPEKSQARKLKNRTMGQHSQMKDTLATITAYSFMYKLTASSCCSYICKVASGYKVVALMTMKNKFVVILGVTPTAKASTSTLHTKTACHSICHVAAAAAAADGAALDADAPALSPQLR